MSDDPQTEGEVHRVGGWYACHETPTERPHEGATLHVWHKRIDGSLFVPRDPDELEHLIALLIECRKVT